MTDFNNEKFRHQAVLLDGNNFKNCEFEDCTLIFNGIAPVDLGKNCVAANNEWRFDGPALHTLNFLTGLYNSGAQALVENIFDKIRKGSQIAPDARPN